MRTRPQPNFFPARDSVREHLMGMYESERGCSRVGLAVSHSAADEHLRSWREGLAPQFTRRLRGSSTGDRCPRRSLPVTHELAPACRVARRSSYTRPARRRDCLPASAPALGRQSSGPRLYNARCAAACPPSLPSRVCSPQNQHRVEQ
jgi:hypothetical protein